MSWFDSIISTFEFFNLSTTSPVTEPISVTTPIFVLLHSIVNPTGSIASWGTEKGVMKRSFKINCLSLSN